MSLQIRNISEKYEDEFMNAYRVLHLGKAGYIKQDCKSYKN